MPNSSTAYDLSRFEQHEPQRRTLKVVKNKRMAQQKRGVSPAGTICLVLSVVAIVALFIYNNVMLTEIGAQISACNAQLADLQDEATRLQATIESSTSVKAIEEIATQELGLSKLERSQVTYIDLSNEDVIEVAEKQSPGIFDTVLAKIKEYLK